MKITQIQLIKISISLFLLLFLLIYYLDENLEIQKTNIEEINKKNLNQKIKIVGNVSDIKYIKNHIFLNIKSNNSSIKGIIFNSEKIIIEKEYHIEGKITIYKEELEIIIEKMY